VGKRRIELWDFANEGKTAEAATMQLEGGSARASRAMVGALADQNNIRAKVTTW
jgi:hypothetical protein